MMPLSLFGGGFGASASSSASLNSGGSGYDSGGGDWNVNIGGSGQAMQGLAGGSMTWLMLAGVGIAAWLLLRK